MGIMKMSDIVITDDFKHSNPMAEKMDECRNNWLNFASQDRYIVLNGNNELIDGYVMYLVLKENGVENAVVKQISVSEV